MGKNNVTGQLETKKLTHFKMYKSGKQWMFAGAAVLGVAAGSQLINQNVAHADTTDSNAGNNYSTSYASANNDSATSVDSITVAQSVSAPSAVDSSVNVSTDQTVSDSSVTPSSENTDVTTTSSSSITSGVIVSSSNNATSSSSDSTATVSSTAVNVTTPVQSVSNDASNDTNQQTTAKTSMISGVSVASTAVSVSDDQGISNRDADQTDYNSLAASQFADDSWLNSVINNPSLMSTYNSMANTSSVQRLANSNYSSSRAGDLAIMAEPLVINFDNLLNHGYLDQAAQLLRQYNLQSVVPVTDQLPGYPQPADITTNSSAYNQFVNDSTAFTSLGYIYSSFVADSSATSLNWDSATQRSFGSRWAFTINNYASITNSFADKSTRNYTSTQMAAGYLTSYFIGNSSIADFQSMQSSMINSAVSLSLAVSNVNSFAADSGTASAFSVENSVYNSIGSGNWNESNYYSLGKPYYVSNLWPNNYISILGWMPDPNDNSRYDPYTPPAFILHNYFNKYQSSIVDPDSAVASSTAQLNNALTVVANHETNVYVKVVASSVANALNQSIADYQSQVAQLSSAVGPLNDSMSALNSHYQMAGSLAQSFSNGSNASVANSLYNIAKNDYSAMSSLATVLSNTNLSLAVGQTNLQQYNAYVSSMLSSANNNGLNDPTSTDIGTIANIQNTASSQAITFKSQATILTSNATQLSSAQSNTSSAVVQLQSLSNALSIASSQAASSAASSQASVAASTADSKANSSAASYAASVASSLAASYSAAQASLAAQSQADSIAHVKQSNSVTQSLQQSIAASQAASQANSLADSQAFSQSASIANSIAVSIAVSSAKSIAASQQASQSASIAKSIADSIAAFNASNLAQSIANANSAAASASIAASLAASTATSIANSKAAVSAASVSASVTQSIANAQSASDAAAKAASLAAQNSASQSASIAASQAASMAQSIANAKSASDAASQSASIAQSIAASLAASVAASSANANTNQNNSGFSVISNAPSSSSNTSLNSSSAISSSSSSSASSSNTNPATIDVNFKQKYYGLDNTKLVQQSRLNTITNLKKIDANNSAWYVGQTVKFRLNGQVHNNFVFSRQNAVKNVKAGTKFKIKAVYVYNGIARFLVGKNQWITANVSYVKM